MLNKKEGTVTSEEFGAKECPKCSGQMVEASRLVTHTRVLADVSLAKKGDILGDRIIPFYCKTCGYIEFYKSPPARYRGHVPESFLKKCIKCSKEIPIASEECYYCGAEQPERGE